MVLLKYAKDSCNEKTYRYANGRCWCFFLKDNKILLGKRKGSHGAGLYSLPGGHLEKGETMVQSAVREIEEETGINISPTNINLSNCKLEYNNSFRVLTTVDEFFPEEDLQYVTVYLLYNYKGNKEPVNKEPHKCEGWDWYSLDNLPNPIHKPLFEGIEVLKFHLYLTKMIKENNYLNQKAKALEEQEESDKRWANFDPNSMKG